MTPGPKCNSWASLLVTWQWVVIDSTTARMPLASSRALAFARRIGPPSEPARERK